MKKTISTIIVVLILIALAVLISQKSARNVKTDTQEPIKIAALVPLTGDAATWGENSKNAIEIAVEEVNATGGINGRRVEVLYEDTAADVKKAVSAFQLSTSINKVTAVTGAISQTEVTALVPLIDQTQTPVIMSSYVPLQNRTNKDNPLLVWMDAEVQAERMAKHVYDQGVRTVAVIGTLDTWETTVSEAFARMFTSLGGKVLLKEIVQPQASDMKVSATKAIGTKPEAIFLGTYYQFVNSVKALHDQGFSGKLFSIEVDEYLAGEGAQWVDHMEFISPDYYSADFTEKFKAKYGRAPGIPSGQSYDAMQIIFALLARGTEQSDIINNMKGFSGYDGVSGRIQVDAAGRTVLPTALFTLEKGVVSRVSSLE